MVTQEDVQHYQVNEIYTALQGEGALAGTPMVLLRLQGCAVGCHFCDTKYTWSSDALFLADTLEEAQLTKTHFCNLSAAVIADYIKRKHAAFKWVLVTGGEPAQQDLAPLTAALHAAGFQCALETSGTALGHIHAAFDWICVSPKVNNPAGLPVLPDAVLPADELKFIIGRHADIQAALEFVQLYTYSPQTYITIQPMSQGKAATKLCIEAAYAYGWRVSLQLHKFMGMA